jgi:hypothetical protein
MDRPDAHRHQDQHGYELAPFACRGHSLQSLKGRSGWAANYVDIDSGDEFWVSGVKKPSPVKTCGCMPLASAAQELGQLGPAGEAELGVDAAEVVVDGADGYVEPLGDDAGCQPVGG